MADYMGRNIMQEPRDLLIWDEFFKKYPVKTVIEFGTGHGGMSLYLGLKCREIGAKFHTYDNVTSSDFMMPIEQEINLAACYICLDIFSDEGRALIGSVITAAEKPLCCFFDDGNKPHEWAIYAPLTAPGDFCVVHDWDTEFFASDIGGVHVERIMTEMSDARTPGGWKAMWFKRT